MMQPESSRQPEYFSHYQNMFRDIFTEKNVVLLNQVLKGLYDQVNSASAFSHFPEFPSEQQISEVFTKGEIQIDVGTGTHGQRIFVQYGSPYMQSGRGRIFMSDDKYGKEYRDVFRKVFNLPEGSFSFEF